jgi:RNA polymerase sigma-70 factor, ECF subfamily
VIACGVVTGLPLDARPDSRPLRDETVEDAVRAALATGDLDGAVTLILRELGPEVLGFMLALTREHAAAGDAFSEFSIDVWRGLRGFAWRSALRTWLYVLARRAVARVKRSGPRAPHIALSEASAISRIALEVRDASLARLEAMHDAFADLRAQLDDEEQIILVLRVDRDMGWREIALVLAPENGTDEDVERLASTLRKRFERIKARIRDLAHAP